MRSNTARTANGSPCGRGIRPPTALLRQEPVESCRHGGLPRPGSIGATGSWMARVISRALGSPGVLRGAVRTSTVRGQEPALNPEEPKRDAGQSAGILIVDDTPANLQVLAGMLKDRGYKVRPVPGGKLALLAARKDPPDLILLDINMPEMNGYEVCERLKADDKLKGIPVIFISALTEQLDKVKAFAIGGVDYITKPFQMEELHARVETHLKLRRLQVELEETNAALAKVNDRMSHDLKAAAKIQAMFLPRSVPRVPGTDFAWIYRPCDELAGDGLNVVPLGEGKVGLYILDVSGHGVASALLSVTLSRLLSPPSEPSSILTQGGAVPGRP